MDTDRPSIYNGPAGTVLVRIRYQYESGVTLQSVHVPVKGQFKRLEPILASADGIEDNSISLPQANFTL